MDDGGRTLAGRYELGEVIGRGAMGTVYRAVDLVLGRAVAVKTLPWLLADQNPTAVARFEREARAAAALSHPALVAVYDTGADASTHFIVMELVAGRSLEAILRDEGPLDPARAAGIAGRVAGALAAAHAAGIVHRDIKPANVMIDENGAVKVLDFGIARSVGMATLTQTASVLGTAAYMAPEQAEGKQADERSDIYALGCVLYALLTGRPPFAGVGVAALLHQHANVAPRPPGEGGAHVPPALSALVMEMLAKSPGDRPQRAAEVRDRLRELSRSPRLAPVVAGAAAAARPAAAAPRTRSEETRATRRLPPLVTPPTESELPTRRRLVAAGALAAAALAIAILALASGGGSPRPVAGVHRGRTASTATALDQGSRRAPSVASASAATTGTASATPARGKTTLTVPQAAGALTALVARDVGSGTIDPQSGQQISAGVAGVVGSWGAGKTTDAQHHLADLSHQVTDLAQQRHIAAAAAQALGTALANLGAALAGSAPAAAGTTGPAASGSPPGHHGLSPGQQKHLDKKGAGGGDQQKGGGD